MIRHLPIAALLLSSSVLAPAAYAQDAAAAQVSKGPANLCKELVVFVQKPEEKKQEAATPPKQATAVSNASGKSDGQPSAAGGDPQQKSGLSGPANADTKAPTSDTRAPVSDGKTVLAQANAAAKSPPPAGATAPSPKPDPALMAQLDAAAGANDQVACRAAARAMRVAGVIMPPPLLALAALNPKFFAEPRP
ncbi:hypothetical protein ASF49_03685 [Methylobacterium sp. Leaf104]|uniref:hypothetical protein n=1 Tax=Methylobacterium TaxID=407 RepID=UPI0006F72565|nr:MULTISPECIES: hypothetical protein [Methylobacterium]KQP42922.1 hypothetical protein ASF49_03685 [Methylobacterium sp. Leaf104]MCI9878467.1 hypothetical protein [Methylobacterium goesingense]